MKGTTRSRSGRGRLGLFNNSFLCRWHGRSCRCRRRFGTRGSDALGLPREGLLAHVNPVVLQLDFLYKVLHVSGPKHHINNISQIMLWHTHWNGFSRSPKSL